MLRVEAIELAHGRVIKDPSYDLVRYMAIRAFGWTQAEVDAVDYGTLMALLAMHNAYERTAAERAQSEMRRARRR